MSRQGKYREPTVENIRGFWEEEAADIGRTPQVTIRDFYFRIHEIHTLLSLIPSNSRLLDVGCGTGFGTIKLARRTNYTLGIDYSEKMIEWAIKLKNDSAYRSEISNQLSPLWDITLPSSTEIEFKVSDVKQFDPIGRGFDVITGQRILINVPNHGEQMAALKNLRDASVDGGLLILVEATIQGYERTDRYRQFYGLPNLEKYWHNAYVDESKYVEWENSGWKVKYDLGFETYVLLSKVIYPAACGHEKCQFLSGANAAAMEMANIFRSRCSVEEVGQEKFLEMYTDRVRQYDTLAAKQIGKWISKNVKKLSDWSRIGPQRLIIAEAS